MAYLIHFNKNHSKANGQFVSGDGDGDGTADEHHRYSKRGIKEKKSKSNDQKTMRSMLKTYEKVNNSFNSSSEGKSLYDRHAEHYQKYLDLINKFYFSSEEKQKQLVSDKEYKKAVDEAFKKSNEYEIQFEAAKSKQLATAYVSKYGIENAAKFTNMKPTKTAEKFIDNYVKATIKYTDKSVEYKNGRPSTDMEQYAKKWLK